MNIAIVKKLFALHLYTFNWNIYKIFNDIKVLAQWLDTKQKSSFIYLHMEAPINGNYKSASCIIMKYSDHVLVTYKLSEQT